MALKTIKLSDALKVMTGFETANFRIIQHGAGLIGLAVKMINNTGVATVKGTLVSTGGDIDNQFILENNEFDCMGVVYEAGVADGQAAWIIIQGVAEVLFKDTIAAVRGYIAIAADTDGRATNVEVPTSNPVVAEHFKEIGHVLESKDAGTDILVKVVLHFN